MSIEEIKGCLSNFILSDVLSAMQSCEKGYHPGKQGKLCRLCRRKRGFSADEGKELDAYSLFFRRKSFGGIMLSVKCSQPLLFSAVILLATAATGYSQQMQNPQVQQHPGYQAPVQVPVAAAHPAHACDCPQCAASHPVVAECGCRLGHAAHTCLSCLTWKHFSGVKSWFHGVHSHASRHLKSATVVAEEPYIAPPPKYLPVPTRPVFAPSPYMPVPSAPAFGGGEGAGDHLGSALTRPGYPRR